MVKVDLAVDVGRFVNPAFVRELRAAGDSGTWIVFGPDDTFFVGQPMADVHARLFPEPPSNMEAARVVLEQIAKGEAGQPLTMQTILLARKALGR